MKKLLLGALAIMCTAVTLHGFELGKNDATIYFNKKNRRAAEEMAHFLNRVYGKKYTTALFKASDAKKSRHIRRHRAGKYQVRSARRKI